MVFEKTIGGKLKTSSAGPVVVVQPKNSNNRWDYFQFTQKKKKKESVGNVV